MDICVYVMYINICERQSQKVREESIVVSMRSNGKLQSGGFLQHIWKTVYLENSEALKLFCF